MKHPWKVWRTWIVAAAIAAPLALLLHELAHLVAYMGYGFPSPVLHYNRASFQGAETFWRYVRLGDFAAAEKIVPIGQAAAASALAPLVTYLTILAASAIATRRRSPFAIAFGLASNIRVLPGVLVLLVTVLGGSASTGDDEQHVAFLTGTPEMALILIGLLIMVISVMWLIQYIPAGRRTVALLGMLIGVVAGLEIYSAVVGPLLLP